ncbi:MAG: hypothetical protein ACOCXT_01170 [Candidatus Dojkabacteria bacterium]
MIISTRFSKHIFISLGTASIILLLGILLADSASASRYIDAGNAEFTLQDKLIQENVYISGENIVVDSEITKDLTIAGEKIRVNGDIGDNLYAAGGVVQIDGNIAGGIIIVNGSINDDLKLAGGQVYINSEKITGDLNILAGEVTIHTSMEIEGEQNLSGNPVML